jgi:predicted secreted hydrolase
MVADTWWLDSGEYYGPSYDGLNLFNADYSLEILKNYKITPLDFWTDPVSKKEFAIRWRVTEPSKQINLTINADFPDQVLHVNRVVDLFFPLLVWEGSCSVSGTIESKSVNGKAFVECSHSS